MDSLSQIALGASVAHLTLGSRLGRGALVLGAALGTLPDLDVLIPYDGAIANFTYHRSFSHSLFVLTFVSFPIAWMCQRGYQRFWRSKAACAYSQWWLGCWLVLVTHPLLDGFTIYGTQLLWPMASPPIACGSAFIIETLYTFHLVVGVVMAYRKSWEVAKPFVITGLTISSCYLAWTLFAQMHVRQLVEEELSNTGVKANRILIAPFPFSVLWRVVVITDAQYLEGYSSLLDESRSLKLDSYNNGKIACAHWLAHAPIQRLDWFTRGAFALSVQSNQLIASDLRMGIEDDYVFEFEIAEWVNGNWQAIKTRQRPVDIDSARMKLLFKRIIEPAIDLTPLANNLRTVPANCQPN
jgi:inner membrane protein